MPRIVVSLTDGQKELWVSAAHREQVSLSEWVRRSCDVRADVANGRGAYVSSRSLEPGVVPRASGLLPTEVVYDAPPVRVFRPDPKKKQ